ncbi:NUP50 [Bugula neritina]|uniref:NUP50 n=1 Tax=Bugula neritina TaxID=10212 RepID=A0A7J7KGZ5_BUGNE|nr:NUP50 [Bugula neritina]
MITMSNKRQATGNLNQDNWDDDEPEEEVGVFKQADENTLKSRVFKKAKRRGVVTSSDQPAQPSLFTGFKGFGKPSVSKSSFTFNEKTTTASTVSQPITFPSFSFTTSNASKSSSPTKVDNSGEPAAVSHDVKESGDSTKFLSSLKWLQSHLEKNPFCYFTPVFKDYETHLAGLKLKHNYVDVVNGEGTNKTVESAGNTEKPESSKNTEVSAAAFSTASKDTSKDTSVFGSAAPSVTANSTLPTMSFTVTSSVTAITTSQPLTTDVNKPAIFGTPATKSFLSTTVTSPIPTFSFGSTQKVSSSFAATENKSSETPSFGLKSFSFGAKPATSSGSTGSSTGGLGAVFGVKPAADSSSDKPAPSLGFSFKTSQPATSSTASTSGLGFSFKSAIAQASTNGGAASGSTEEEEYVPPKPEVENKITEEDSVYTKRVKLFYEKEGKYVDKGVGNLFIKPIDGGKYSVLIRADTNLGNILLNIALAPSIPVKRMGKNNVSLLCIANPPMDIKAKDSTAPTMLLVRVKTEADADELCAKIDEYKKS